MTDKDKPGRGAAGGPKRRGLSVRVKGGKTRKPSSQRWLTRHLNDPYVREARAQGYRSRAAFKLAQLDDRFRFLKKGARVVDLGAAPGGWSQVAAERTGADRGQAPAVIAADLLAMGDLPGVEAFQGDIDDEATLARIVGKLGGKADVVLSDMAPATTGHSATDHVRIVRLAEGAVAAAIRLLRPGGTFVAKVFQGGAQGEVLALLKRHFASVRHAKPEASRPESPETYVVATGFRAGAGPPLESGGTSV